MAIPTRPISILFIITLTASLTISTYSCSNNDSTEQIKSSSVEGFTFFNLGSNSLLTDQVRKKLEDQLGSGAIEVRSTIDLSIHFPGFLKSYFPHLEELNNKLNWPPQDRVEHNITKLMYRYANKKKLPFSYIELFFSNYTGQPIFFRIYASSEGASMVATLIKKYGPAQNIQWSEKNGNTFYWEKHEDILTASETQNRYGRPEYLFCIFYVGNIKQIVEREKKEQKIREEKIKNAGKAAF